MTLPGGSRSCLDAAQDFEGSSRSRQDAALGRRRLGGGRNRRTSQRPTIEDHSSERHKNRLLS